jgi:hypothetical protein
MADQDQRKSAAETTGTCDSPCLWQVLASRSEDSIHAYLADLLPQAINFLKSRGVLADDEEVQTIRFTNLADPNSANTTYLREYYTKARNLLLHLFDPTDTTSKDTIPSDVHQFSEVEFPGYEKENVFFLKHPMSLVQLHQFNGLCYMHAPAVVQHYRVADNHSGNTIDLKGFILNHFSAKQLEQHIFNNEGEHSRWFLESILQTNPTIIAASNVNSFSNYGVGLVSQFKVHEDFCNVNVHKHYGSPSGTYKGKHAMALVGHRQTDGRQFFLLQNWWKQKQFVEVDKEYLVKSGATVYFIKTPQPEIPLAYLQLAGKFFELEAIDKPEGYVHEMKSKGN